MAHRVFIACYFLAAPLGAWASVEWGLVRVLPALLGCLLLVFAAHRRGILRAARRASGASGSRLWPYEGLVELIQDLDGEAEAGSFAAAEENLRRLGLHEIWATMQHPNDSKDLFDGVLGFLQHQGGFFEMAVLRLEPSSREILGSWVRSAEDGLHVKRIQWGIGGLGGALGDVLRQPAPLEVASAEIRPLVLLNGEPPHGFERHEGGYLVVPLLSPLPKPECFQHRRLYRPECPALEILPHRATSQGGGGSACLRCRHFPVHGLLVVTDYRRDRPIRPRDRMVVEALSYSVGAVLNHSIQHRATAEAEEFRDHILDAMSNGVVTTDAAGRIVFANRRAHELTGLGPQVIGRPLDDIIDIRGAAGALANTLRGGAEAMNVDGVLRTVTANGERSQRPVRLNLGPYQVGASGPRGAVCVFADTSGVKAMEEEIRHLDTLAAVGRFASSLAHEVRNPLAGIRAGIDFMRRAQQFPQEFSENVSIIDGEISRLDAIITELLTVVRPDAVELSRIDANQLARRTLGSVEAWAAERGVALELEATAASAILADGDKIQQVLLNLIKNAIEASAAGATVRVEARAATPADAGEDFPVDPREATVFSVADEGEGIAADHQARLFEPFFTTKATGTGLGLFVCHNLVQRHGGALRVHSAPGIGTRFDVLLPNSPVPMGGRSETPVAAGR